MTLDLVGMKKTGRTRLHYAGYGGCARGWTTDGREKRDWLFSTKRLKNAVTGTIFLDGDDEQRVFSFVTYWVAFTICSHKSAAFDGHRSLAFSEMRFSSDDGTVSSIWVKTNFLNV
jgi:hypothetical protein